MRVEYDGARLSCEFPLIEEPRDRPQIACPFAIFLVHYRLGANAGDGRRFGGGQWRRQGPIRDILSPSPSAGMPRTADFVSDHQVVQCRILPLSSHFAFRAATYARRLRPRPRVLPCDDNQTEASVVFLAISEACRPWCGSRSLVLPASDLGIIPGAFRLMRVVDWDGANF
jgi:hypothetical protein